MFDVELGGGESYKESRLYTSGNKAQFTDTDFGRLGMTICYDMRFPDLFRALAQKGVKIFSVPSAFTKVTGEAHWHSLLKARAIETGSFILAPAQVGLHGNGRETFGHSLVVNPWGGILSDGKLTEGVLTASLNLEEADQARARIPSLSLNQAFEVCGP
jgi:predicted amidohydrolase